MPDPKEYAQMWTNGGGDPTFDEIDGFLFAHFGARAVHIDRAVPVEGDRDDAAYIRSKGRWPESVPVPTEGDRESDDNIASQWQGMLDQGFTLDLGAAVAVRMWHRLREAEAGVSLTGSGLRHDLGCRCYPHVSEGSGLDVERLARAYDDVAHESAFYGLTTREFAAALAARYAALSGESGEPKDWRRKFEIGEQENVRLLSEQMRLMARVEELEVALDLCSGESGEPKEDTDD